MNIESRNIKQQLIIKLRYAVESNQKEKAAQIAEELRAYMCACIQ